MKQLSISLIAAMLPLWGMAQSRVEYTYDNAGNRLLQSVIHDEPDDFRNSLMSTNQIDSQGSTQSRQLDGHTVSVTTFPGTGMVRVEVLGLEDSDDCRFSVYNMSGIQLLSQQAESTQTMLDLSSFPKSFYILLVRLNSESATWKIIYK